MLYLRLLFKNAFRHRLRTALTITGIAVAILAFGLLRTVVGAWYAGVNASAANRLVTRNAISLVFMLPSTYKERIRQVEGVKIVSWGSWFGGIYIEEKNFFPNFAVDPRTYLELYPEYILSDGEKKAFVFEKRACVAGRLTAQKYGWRLGDIITLKGTIFPGNWEFVLRGIYRGRDKGTDESQFFFSWDYLNDTMRKTAPGMADQIGFFMIGIEDPDRAAETVEAIDKTFKNSKTETLTETEKAFQMGFVAMSEAIVIAIRLVSFVVITIIMAVTANTMAMSVRERTIEFTVLKTLGFGAAHMAGLIFGEAFVITATGCIIGVIATFPAAEAFGNAMSTFLPVFNISAETLVFDVAIAAATALVAGLIPTARILRTGIAEGLRKIA